MRGCPFGQPCLGSPCFAATGNYTTSAVDIQIASGSFPLVVARNYESATAIDGPLGIGWTLNLTSHLFYAVYLYAAPSTYQKEADIVTPNGARYRFTENADGSFTPPVSRHDTLVKNGDGTFDLTIADGSTKYHYLSSGALDNIADEFGNKLQFTYDANGRLQRMADVVPGRYLDIYFGADGRVSTVSDNSGRHVQYQYNTTGALTSVTDAANRVTTYTYVTVRATPQLSRITDNWGRVVTDVTYDTQGRTQAYTEGGESYTYTYNYNGRADQSSKVDSAGNRWIYTYAADGPITQRDYPGTTNRQVVYNADRSIQLQTDEVGVKTYYTYTPLAGVASVTKDYQGPLAVRFDYTYDPNFPNKITSILPKNPTTNAYDPNWQGWQYDYYQPGSAAPGALFHVYRLHDDGTTRDTVATYEFDTHGRVTAVTDATGGRSDYAYDASGNLFTVTGPSNNDGGVRPVMTYGYDSLGRVTSVTDPLNHGTTYTYDAADRVLTVTLPKPTPSSTLNFTTTYTYDSYDAGTQLLATVVTDPNGNATTQKYDVFGRLVKNVDALNNTTTYGYSRALLSSITDANGYVASYSYDSLGRLTRTTFPDAAYETYTYFGDSLLQSRTDRKNQTIQYAYDHLKRLTTKTYPNATSISYSYQGQKLTQVADTSTSPSETHTFSYDNVYRVASNTQATRGTIGYAYDAADRTSSYTITGGTTASYTYYPDGSLNTIQWTPVSGQVKYAYMLTGQYGTITFPNGQTKNFSYDDQGRLTQLVNLHPSAGNLATYAYGYDLNNATGGYTMLGQRTSMTATVPAQSFSSALTKYYYDNLYQLTRADYPNAAPFNGEIHSWLYDAIGNRLTNTVNGVTQSYTYQTIGTNPKNWQRLASDGTNIYTYDANGNTATRTGFTFGWDYENRMSSITGAPNASYAYDYSGRRASKTVAGISTTYLYDRRNLVSEASSGATADHLLGPGIDEPLASNRGGVVVYHAVDGLGSVSLTVDPAAVIRNSYAYDAWGVTRSSSEAFAQPFRYTAREIGEIADLAFYRARYLSRTVGRFLSEDQLERYLRVASLEAFKYAANSPVMFDDPYGLICSTRPIFGLRETIGQPIIQWTRWRQTNNSTQLPHVAEGNPTAEAGQDAAMAGGYAYGPPDTGPSFGIVPWTPEKCIWRRYLLETDFWRQKVALELRCDCPPRQEIQSAGYRYGRSVSVLRRQTTYTDGMSDIFGIFAIDCQEPPE